MPRELLPIEAFSAKQESTTVTAVETPTAPAESKSSTVSDAESVAPSATAEGAATSLQTPEKTPKRSASIPKRISIKESLERAMTEQSNPDGSKMKIGSDPFDQSSVTEAIMELMKERKGDGKLYLALLSNLSKVEGESIMISFDNEEDLKSAEPYREGVERRLAERLNNSSLSLHFMLSETPPDGKKERRLFTGRDRVAYFEEKNPEVANLIRTLSLELE